MFESRVCSVCGIDGCAHKLRQTLYKKIFQRYGCMHRMITINAFLLESGI